MKTRSIILLLATAFCTFLQAQEAPKPPQPGTTNPPTPPTSKEKEDTTKLKLGNKEIIIMESKKQRDDDENESEEELENELEESLEEMRESLKEAREELKKALEELKVSGKDHQEVEKELERAQKELERADREMESRDRDRKKDRNQLKLQLELENQQNENSAPTPEPPAAPRKKRKSASVGFIDIDLGLNFMKYGSQISEQTKSDLELKNWNSLSTTLTFLPTKIYFGTPHLMLMTGLSWRISQIEFKEKLNFEPNKILTYTKQDNIKESQFMTHYLQVPLGVYLESKKIKGLGRIGLGVGGYAGVLLHQEHELERSDINQFIETEEDFGIKNFRYGVSGRIDIGAVKFFANMDLNDYWKGHDIQNIECGLWFDF